MAVTCTGEDRVLTLAIAGEVDHHRAGEIMGELERHINFGLPRLLTIDLGGVTFMDSSGIAVLLRAYKRLGELGGAVRIKNVPMQAGKVLKAAGLQRLMQFDDGPGL